MEAWEKRYLHARDFRDCMCLQSDTPIPEDPKYGTLANLPDRAKRVFHGPKFWPEFEKRGHDTAEYERCRCHKGE